MSGNDFSEILLKYMARHPQVFRKCRDLRVLGDDFVLDEQFGNQIYKEFADTINNIASVPILQDTFMRHIDSKIENGVFDVDDLEGIIELIGFMYGTPVDDPGFFDKRLPEFLQEQRTKRAVNQHRLSQDPNVLAAELNRIKFQIDTATSSDVVKIVHPFRELILQTKAQLIGTNIDKLDAEIEGLQLGEYAMIVGYSGSGKSALGSNIVSNSAEAGVNATYLSCEDTLENMSMRFYAKVFEIPYKELRNGLANFQLAAMHSEMDCSKRSLLANCLSLISVKGVTEITPDFLYAKMVHEYEETGFVPSIVMLDQMQFVTPDSTVRKASAAWELEKLVSAELDELSHKSIGGRNFVLWVQHQAKGKLKKRFTRDDIDGFKGVIHKTDLTIGVGRDPNNNREIDLFSIKVRHTADFGITLRTNFRYMSIDSDCGDVAQTENYTQPTENPNPQRQTTSSPEVLPANPMAHYG